MCIFEAVEVLYIARSALVGIERIHLMSLNEYLLALIHSLCFKNSFFVHKLILIHIIYDSGGFCFDQSKKRTLHDLRRVLRE